MSEAPGLDSAIPPSAFNRDQPDRDRADRAGRLPDHAMGDRLIQHAAQVLKRHIRCADYVFRWGGDEFVVLMSCAEREAIRKRVRLKAAFGASIRRWALPPGVGLRVGCAGLGRSAPDVEALLTEADARMYADKHGAAAGLRTRPAGATLASSTQSVA